MYRHVCIYHTRDLPRRTAHREEKLLYPSSPHDDDRTDLGGGEGEVGIYDAGVGTRRGRNGIYEKGEGEEEGVRWKIPICSRGPAGSISSSVALFGFLDDITLGDGNNARFDRAFVDE